MDKKRLSKVLAKASAEQVAEIAEKIKENYEIVLVKEPSKTLTMIKMREPVKSSLFYIGEVIVTECIVEIDGTKGIAVTMGDNFEKTLDMAVIDAACNKGVFGDMETLLNLEKEQNLKLAKENAMHLKTMVNFNSLDASEVALQNNMVGGGSRGIG
jgi:alpha-D-ribose 1-methylphosphonate 5-triphosphate synthase subunit PhnG